MSVKKPDDDDVINTYISINTDLFETYFKLFAFIVIFRQVYYLINTFISINIELFGTYFDLFAFILIFRQVYYFKNISRTYFVLFAFIVIFRQVYYLKKNSKKVCQPGFEPGLARAWEDAQPLGYHWEIGRASCRERVSSPV